MTVLEKGSRIKECINCLCCAGGLCLSLQQLRKLFLRLVWGLHFQLYTIPVTLIIAAVLHTVKLYGKKVQRTS